MTDQSGSIYQPHPQEVPPAPASSPQAASLDPRMSTQQPFVPPTPEPAPLNPAPGETPPTALPTNPNLIKEEVLLEWDDLSRPFKKRNRQYFSTVFMIALLLCLILFFAGQFLPIAVVVAAAFLAYVLAVIPPGNVKYAITTFGIRIENQLYFWEELGRFWVTQKYGKPILNIEVGRFPWRLTILPGEMTEDDINTIFSDVLLNQVPEPTVFEKAANWIQEKIPLE